VAAEGPSIPGKTDADRLSPSHGDEWIGAATRPARRLRQRMHAYHKALSPPRSALRPLEQSEHRPARRNCIPCKPAVSNLPVMFRPAGLKAARVPGRNVVLPP